MCGIVGYIGGRSAWPIVINGLKKLEYRGYDSAGIAVINENGFGSYKKSGNVAVLEDFATHKDQSGHVAIGHTRWATHGVPSDANSHPHASSDNRLHIVHNGIIENYASLKELLISRGHQFNSDTDTEVLIRLIEEIQRMEETNLVEALRTALKSVVGAYAIVILDRDHPDQLVAARKGSPLVIGVGQGEFFIASDAGPISAYSKRIIYLNDDEIALVKADGLLVTSLENVIQTPMVHELELELETMEKGNFDHFMLKEIFEQRRSIQDCIRGRIDLLNGKVILGGIEAYSKQLQKAQRIIIVGCGTSWHAGLSGEYLIEKYARIPVEVEYASEFRYRDPIILPTDIVIAISQSGETADTLAAIVLAKSKGALVFGICNVVGSSIPRLTDAGIYTHAGPEIGVASTKAYTAQVTVLTLLALYIADLRNTIAASTLAEILTKLEEIPEIINSVLQCNDIVEDISNQIMNASNCMFIGRGNGFPVALEGALKLKEISYIHAEGYPAAEMKHGPIALIEKGTPVIVIALKNSSYDKVMSNIQEVKARGALVVAITTKGDSFIQNLADYCIEIPDAEEAFLPLLATIPLQLLAYHIAVLRGCNVDQPRNLAKSVTVE